MGNDGAGAVAVDAAQAGAALAWRPLTTSDIPALTRLLEAAEQADHTGEHQSEDDVAEALVAPGLDLSRDAIAAALPDGELVSFGAVRAPRAAAAEDRIFLHGTVHPAHRRQGLGSRLLDWLEQRAAQSHQERFPQLPGEYEVETYEQISGRVALYERAGYRPVRWWNVMRRDVASSPTPPNPVPDGLRLIAFDPAYDDAVRRAHNEAFSSHWGSSERDPAEWAKWFTGQRSFDPTSSFLILDGEEIAAYLLAYFWAAEAAATGVREGFIGQLGTRPAWRRRGFASVLLDHALVAFHAAGYQRAALDVDTENASGALGLYVRHGYGVAERQISYVRPIS
jgi:mycothiol synthase